MEESQSDASNARPENRIRATVVAAILLAPMAATIVVLFVAALGPGRSIPRGDLEGGGWTSRTRGWLDLRGFYPAELDGDHAFSWMGGSGRIRVPRLNRSVGYQLSLWVRPAVSDHAVDLRVTVDGLAAPLVTLTQGVRRIDIDLPPRRADGALVGLNIDETVVPGPDDPRVLGMRIDAIALTPASGMLKIPFQSLRAAALGALGFGVLLAFTAAGRWTGVLLGSFAGAWLGVLVAYDASFLGVYADRVMVIGATLAALGLLIGCVNLPHERWSFRSAFGAVTVVAACKLALFFHPMVTVGDSVFHVHRAQVVQGGEYFFTSVTPRPFFEFPYPPGLYVVAAPLWHWFRGDGEHVWLLRTIVIVAEALVGLAIYVAVFANRRDRPMAWLAAVLFMVVPIGLYTICTSNLTNSFAQSVFSMGFAALLCAHLRYGWVATCAGTALVLAGFLSHFSTFSVGVPLLSATAALLFVAGQGPARRVAAALALAVLLATSISVVVYYAHFMPVYRQTVSRILAREGEAKSRSMVAPVEVKAQRASSAIRQEFGLAILLAAFIGGIRLFRERDPLARALTGWLAVAWGFWLLGVLTPIEMRVTLAAQPLAAILAAGALSQAIRGGPIVRASAMVLVALIGLHAVSDWIMCLGSEWGWKI